MTNATAKPLTFFVNVYREKNRQGILEVAYSTEEISIHKPEGLTSLWDVKQDIFQRLSNEWSAEYVATLSADGINHTPDMAKFASEIADDISVARGMAGWPCDNWEECQSWASDPYNAGRSDYEEHNTHNLGGAL